MELVAGGAFSGKMTYVKRKYEGEELRIVDLEESDGRVPPVLPDGGRTVFTHVEALSRRLAEGCGTEEDALTLLGEAALSGNTVIIARETGCGIVPIDPVERRFRELHGRLLQKLAARAERVTRIVCGIAEEIK